LIAQKSDSFSPLSENQTVLKVCPLQKRGISVIIKRKKKQGVLPKGVEPLDKKKKVDQTVRRETLYITAVVLILSVLMQAVFLIIRQWDYTVLLGNLLGGGVAVLNFFLMGLTVQKATSEDEKRAKTVMHTSQVARTFAMFGVAVLGALLDCFNIAAVLIPLFFPSISVLLRPLFSKRKAAEK
jgi:hypothetical protein